MKHVIYSCFITACILSQSVPTRCENIFVDGSAYADSAQVSLFDKTSFVIRGTMSPAWNGQIRLAVTDPIKNNGHTIHTSEGNRFEKTIHMRGSMQKIYLYVPGTMAIPVCAGDTINLTLDDDDLTLYSNNHAANLDLQLAHTLYKKARKHEHTINSLSNTYLKLSKWGTIHNSETDSIKDRLITEFYNYNTRYNTVIDTFIKNNGIPRLEKQFRIAGFYHMLGMISMTDIILTPQFRPLFHLDSANKNIPFNIYHDSFLAYPEYRDFVNNYISANAYPIIKSDPENSITEKLQINTFNIYRTLSHTQFLSDWINLRYWAFLYRINTPESAVSCLKYVYESTENKDIKDEYAKFMPEIVRLSQGEPAPHISMTDINGNICTLDDFKGKYLYLDFWDFGCGPCIHEFSVIPKLKEHFADIIDNVEIVTVCLSKPSKKKFNDFVLKNNMNDQNFILDKKNSDSCYDISTLPTYVLINPQGKIVEFNTDRPSVILQKSKLGKLSVFERSLQQSLFY